MHSINSSNRLVCIYNRIYESLLTNLILCHVCFFLIFLLCTKSYEDYVVIEESINAVGLKIQRFDSDTMTPSACRSALALSYSLPLW